MTTREIKIVKDLLDRRAERFSTASIDTGGFCLTAYWYGGGQKIFRTVLEVINWLEEH